MRHFHWMMLFPLCCLVTFAGCGNSPDSLMKQQISLMNDMADAIEDGDESALESLKSRGEALRKKMNEMDISVEENRRLHEKYKDDFAKAMQRVMAANMSKMMGGVFSGMPGMPAGMPGLPTP